MIAYMLLSDGSLPFDAGDDKGIRLKIEEGKYNTDGPMWEHVSEPAKAFVHSLLEYDPEKRPTAEEALQSQWLQRNTLIEDGKPDEEVLDDVQDALVHSVEEPKLKRLSMMIIAHCAPAQKLNELRHAFDNLDRSHDGTISFGDFQAALRDCEFAEDQLREIFQELDQNDTGVIHYTEFLSATLETRGKIEEELVEEAFEKLDTGNKGTINKEDLCSVLEATNPSNECEDAAEKLLEEADIQNDGELCVFLITLLLLYI